MEKSSPAMITFARFYHFRCYVEIAQCRTQLQTALCVALHFQQQVMHKHVIS